MSKNTKFFSFFFYDKILHMENSQIFLSMYEYNDGNHKEN